eukprot:SAG11_NODE_4209_length_2013_cov_8.216301_1_plen_154_part_00
MDSHAHTTHVHSPARPSEAARTAYLWRKPSDFSAPIGMQPYPDVSPKRFGSSPSMRTGSPRRGTRSTMTASSRSSLRPPPVSRATIQTETSTSASREGFAVEYAYHQVRTNPLTDQMAATAISVQRSCTLLWFSMARVVVREKDAFISYCHFL